MSGIAGFTTLELEQAREDLGRYRPETVVQYRNVGTRTTGGGTTYAMTLIDQGPGTLSPMGSEAEAQWLDRLGTSRGWVITVDEDRDIRINDELRIGARKFAVMGWDQDRSYPMSQRVIVREISQ